MVPIDEIRIFKDGNRWCAVFGDFADLHESESGWGDTPSEALDALLKGPSEQARVFGSQG
jgi:hypothetical protein